MTSGTPVSYVNQIPSATDLVNGKNSLGTISFDAGAPNVVFETYWDDGGGFRIDGSSLYLRDSVFFEVGDPSNLMLTDAATGQYWPLSGETPTNFVLKVSGDVTISSTTAPIFSLDGKYFGHATAEVSSGGGYTFTPQNFNSFEKGAVLGTLSAGFEYDYSLYHLLKILLSLTVARLSWSTQFTMTLIADLRS